MPDDDQTMKLPDPATPLSAGELLARALGDPGPTGGGRWVPPTPEELSALLPQYRIEALIGHGGMGAVYKGVQVALKRPVAIKLLPLEISADPAFARRFEHEAQTLAKLSHPNIVAVHDFGTTSEGHLYFVMEFVEGTDLHKMIHGPGLSPAQSLSIIIAVCEALQYAHGKGVVHRDIKPANVMVNTEGVVKVADFGLARLNTPDAESGGLTMTGTVMGTPAYMAPEQTRGMNVDHRADIYSLGVMLYEMLCGEIPRGVFDPPSHKVQVDVRLDEVVLKAMHSQPERRYQNTVEMKTDVDRIRTTNAEGGTRKAEKNTPRTRVAAIAAVCLALATVTGFFFWKKAHDPGRAERSSPSPTTSASSASTWQPLFTDAELRETKKKGREFTDGMLHVKGGGAYKPQPSANAAIRAKVRLRDGAKDATIKLRGATPGSGYRCALNWEHVSLSCIKEASYEEVKLGSKVRPKPKVGETVLLELRAQGSHLTALVDGAVMIEADDDTLKEPGQWGVSSQDGWFESVEVQTLPALPAKPAASDGWQPLLAKSEWQRSQQGREFKDGLLHIQQGGKAYKSQPSADGALRAKVVLREGSRDASLKVHKTLSAGCYTLYLFSAWDSVRLSRDGFTGKEDQVLRIARFPKPLKVGDSVLLELRAQGNHLTALVDGVVMIEADDDTLKEPGQWGVSSQDGWFESVEVQPLGAAPMVSPSPAPAEEWQDLLHDPAKLRLDDNVARKADELRLPAAAVVRASASPKDGAIRIRSVFAPINQALAWARDSSAGHYTLAAYSHGKAVRLSYWLREGGTPSTTLQDFSLPHPLQPGQEYELELRAVGSTLTARVDGRLLGSFEDSRLPSGGFALQASSKQGDAPPVVVRSLEFLDLEKPTAGSLSPVSQVSKSSVAAATKDTPFTNTLGMKFVPVPITDGPTGGQRVLFSVWETRVQDYEVFVAETKTEWSKPKFKHGPTHPAVNLRGEAAVAFCAWLTERERKASKFGTNEAYRLPTDHEWSCAVGIGGKEDAAALPDAKRLQMPDVFPWGKTWPPPSRVANLAGDDTLTNAEKPDGKGIPGYRDGFVFTAPVGSFAANAFGLFDLSGNAAEWCEDQRGHSPHPFRVTRGGGYKSSDRAELLSSNREWAAGNVETLHRGFRVVLAPTAP